MAPSPGRFDRLEVRWAALRQDGGVHVELWMPDVADEHDAILLMDGVRSSAFEPRTPRQPVPDPFQNTRERALLPRKKRIASKQFLFQLSLTRSPHMAHA